MAQGTLFEFEGANVEANRYTVKIKSGDAFDEPLRLGDHVEFVISGAVVDVGFNHDKDGRLVRTHTIESAIKNVIEMPVRGLLEAVADQVNDGALDKDGIKVTASVR